MTRIPASPDLPAAVAAAQAHLAACADERRTPRRDCRHRFWFPCPGCGTSCWCEGSVLARNGEEYIARARCVQCFFASRELHYWQVSDGEVRPC